MANETTKIPRQSKQLVAGALVVISCDLHKIEEMKLAYFAVSFWTRVL